MAGINGGNYWESLFLTLLIACTCPISPLFIKNEPDSSRTIFPPTIFPTIIHKKSRRNARLHRLLMSFSLNPYLTLIHRLGPFGVLIALIFSICLVPIRADEQSEGMAFFEKNIRPVLVNSCYGCHSTDAAKAGKLKGGLMLDNIQGLLTGGESGPALVPGKASESLIMEALRYETYEMPPKGKLPDAVIASFEKWINMGAPDPRSVASAAPTPRLSLIHI